MTLRSSRQYTLTASTIGELRGILAECTELPDGAVVRAKVGFGNPTGAKIKNVTVIVDEPGLPVDFADYFRRTGDQP